VLRLVASIILIIAGITLAPEIAHAQGGPPLITDDPDTPGPGYWEINFASEAEVGGDAHRVEFPSLDINYGAGERIQLKFEIPWVAAREADWDRGHGGIGNGEAGVKWRFLGDEGKRLAWSVYPQVAFHTSPRLLDDDPGDRRPILHMPTELTLEIPRLELNGEIGRSFVSGGADTWFGGISTEVHATPRVEVVAEIHDDKRSAEPSELFVNIGARPQITQQLRLLLAIGRTVHSGHDVPTSMRIYAGLQFNVPHIYEWTSP
jgi:hypothetical protein